MTEATRQVPTDLDDDGVPRARLVASPVDNKQRAEVTAPPPRVIPVFFLPGIMGSNLKAKAGHPLLAPGESVWRPPNGIIAGLREVRKWSKRGPADRQMVLGPDLAEVDDSGTYEARDSLHGTQVPKDCGWGEVHWDSYGKVLNHLHRMLKYIFARGGWGGKGEIKPAGFWPGIIEADRESWGAAGSPALTEEDLKQLANAQYPVYACGYNWLQSNEKSADIVEARIAKVIKEWNDKPEYRCDKAILVTHSMGGFVARAAAKKNPAQILFVFHSVQPAVGAPEAYRRMVCGAPGADPSDGWIKRKGDEAFATIIGQDTTQTTPVLACAPGPMELLPNHLYPGKWLYVGLSGAGGRTTPTLELPDGDIYDLYREARAWYRLVDPNFVDPAQMYADYKDGPMSKVRDAIKQAERFHKEVMGNYYHTPTYAQYGSDRGYPTVGAFGWVTDHPAGFALTEAQLRRPEAWVRQTTGEAELHLRLKHNHQSVVRDIRFRPTGPDAPGDGTVPYQSGRAPEGQPGVRGVFRTQGHDHQGSYEDTRVLQLMCYLIARTVKELA
ncbi:hypothetical protein QFW77_12195 [Luteimonas sp. RD2P54]|uniref:PGAP1-like protein n=1 Tax=Luteimonas endophytica TaxID=3042023 RepID=A0ABT6JC41_9GAMM|nr:hypothetical protein [Luteimonas endophytica]MDH5823748.1 hypothetical protein [Luteimonas endophytica]